MSVRSAIRDSMLMKRQNCTIIGSGTIVPKKVDIFQKIQ